jgi:putative N-acetyltransferase (TIGR04045 family)
MTAELAAPRTREVCRLVTHAADLAAHHWVRRSVFVEEQHVFAGSDLDGWDDDPVTLHVLGLVDGRPAGSVRLYPLGDGDWKGDRLAVLPGSRAGRLGASLVRFAVATAAGRGGARMIALVQAPNEVFFRRLGWSRLEALDYVGLPHVRMEISLR